MSEKVRILVANPAGNKTILVLDEFGQNRYKDIAEKLLAMSEINAEQVGFVVKPKNEGQGRMEMCGQEFCGNASRSFGLYMGNLLGIKGPGTVTIEVSGAENPLAVEMDTLTNHTKISMPLASEIMAFQVDDEKNLSLVLFDGIVHVVAEGIAPSLAAFNRIKSIVLKMHDTPAIGVMFYDKKRDFLTPVVWVRDVDSTYFEGSCGSGSVAVASVLAETLNDGCHTFKLEQPAGSLEIIIIKEKGLVKNAFLQGQVELNPPITVSI